MEKTDKKGETKKLLVDDKPDIPVEHDFKANKTFTGTYSGESHETGGYIFDDVNDKQWIVPAFPAIIEAMEHSEVVASVNMTFTYKGTRNSDGREMFTITIN